MIRSLSVFGVCLPAAMWCSASAIGQITYVSQSRSIEAHAVSGAVSDQHSMSAPDFGPFNAMVSANAFNPDTGFSGFGTGRQDSVLGLFEIDGGGSWTGGRTGQAGLPSGGGMSNFDLRFSLAAATPFTFEATIGGGTSFIAFIYLSGGPGAFPDIRTPGTYSGVLQPGLYEIAATTSGSAGFPQSSGGSRVHLIIPAPGGVGLAALGVMALGRRSRRGAMRC